MADLPKLDFKSFVDGRKQAQFGGALSTGRDYAYVSDKQMRKAFKQMRGLELAVSAGVRLFEQVGRAQLLGSAVKVSERQFPRIYGLIHECASKLHIPLPRVYIVNHQTLNAATYGTNDESFILVHSALVDHYTDEELRTVLGHECGHIHNSHVVYLTALKALTDIGTGVGMAVGGPLVRLLLEPTVLLALRAWSRRAEITCDRAGMLCSESETVAARALTKLALGSKRLYEDFNVDAFLEQYEEGKEGLGKYMEVFASHPWLPKRVLAMRVFAESSLFREASNRGPGGISMGEVDERVLALLKGDA